MLTCVASAHTFLKLMQEVVGTPLSIILAPGVTLRQRQTRAQTESCESVVEAEGDLETPILTAQAGMS